MTFLRKIFIEDLSSKPKVHGKKYITFLSNCHKMYSFLHSKLCHRFQMTEGVVYHFSNLHFNKYMSVKEYQSQRVSHG